jgi:hypothetical protein
MSWPLPRYGGGMSDLLQLAGALLILVPFAAVQLGRSTPASVAYLALNLAGSLLLAVLALAGEQWGFLLLETVWALVSGWGLSRRARGLPVAGAGSEAGAH